MREILFRGKRNDKGNWIYGYYVFQKKRNGCFGQTIADRDFDRHYVIIPRGESFEVIPETVGQYTGLTDKNGTKIFEGDIVKCTDKTNDYDFTAVVLFGNPNGRYDWGFQLKQISGEKANTDILLWVEMEEGGAFIEVIGNIYDNPELIKF